MRRWLVLVVVLVSSVTVGADDRRRSHGVVPEVIIPVDPYEHERLHYFGRRDHHAVPGTITINKAPYRCDLDRRAFTDRDDFVAHVRTAHKTPIDEIFGRTVLKDGVVHFVAAGHPPAEGSDARR